MSETSPHGFRALFVNENIGGNATMHLHMRRVLAQEHPEVDASFLDVPSRGLLRRLAGVAVPGLGRFDLDLAPARAQIALSAHVRRQLGRGPGPYDVIHAYTHNAVLLSTGLLGRVPSVVGLDATTVQSTRLLPFREPTRFTALSTAPSVALERRVYQAVDMLVAKSEWARASLVDDYGIEPERIQVIPYGIAITPRPPVDRRGDQILFVGRSMDRKGGWLLVDAWRRHLRSDARLVLVTPEPVPEEPGLTVISDLRTGEDRLLELMASSTVLAFPSTGDTFGYAALEAMAMETPVVGFRAAALPEIVSHGATGLLVEPGDVEGLAGALASVLGDEERSAVLGAAARTRVLEHFDARTTTKAVVDLLERIVRSSSAREGAKNRRRLRFPHNDDRLTAMTPTANVQPMGAPAVDEPAHRAPLGGHVASGVRWGLVNQVVQQTTRFGVQLVLTRLLAPEAFGVMAIALILVNLGTLLSGLGFSQALIQRPQITRAQIDAALAGSLLLGVALAGSAVLAASPVAGYFGEPQVAPILRALSAVFVFQSLEGVPNSMLRRAFRFREFSMSSALGAVVGGLAGLALGLAGAGVWALVGFAVTEAAVATTLGWVFAVRAGVWRPGISFDLRPLSQLLSYSGAVTGTRLVVFGIRNVDNLIVGRMLGAVALGYYGLAYRLMLIPIQRFADVLANVTLPAFARMDDDPLRLGNAFLRAVRVLASVVLPITIGTAVTAPLLVPLLFGDQWEPAVAPVQVLCLSGPALAMSRLNGNLFEATGRAWWTLLVSLASLVVLVPAFLLGVQHGTVGVAVAYTVTAYAGVAPSLWLVRRCTDAAIGRQLVNVVPILLATVTLATTAAATRAVLHDVGGVVVLSGMVVLGGTAYLASLAILDRGLVLETLQHLRIRRSESASPPRTRP